MAEKREIRSCTRQELTEMMEEMGEKRFRGEQVYQWIHQKLAEDFDEMTNLPKSLREKLKEQTSLHTLHLEERQVSQVDKTEKYLFSLEDGNMIESVLMRHAYGNSVCISSQAGCRMGCRFCASGIGGLRRNLSVGEMLGQVYEIQRRTKERVSHVVVMGTGEPLDNYENFVAFLRMISDGHGLNISQRNITASTCGIVPGILRLAKEKFQITLALSLHGSSQEKRKRLMPVASSYPLDQVMEACDVYLKETGRRVSFEYSLVADVNDTEEDIRELTELLKGRNCHVNVIPVNPIREREFKKPGREKAMQFKNKLEKNGINVTIRKERGSDIDGACGQLRRRHITSE
ncbi:23S rRNA (adenine(2503)-C(2))-methyltransferase RlmN [Suipraeoptans intestinalis]|uniref:23S rRNA (adenine(2503)-C(2))-methyltransferase RlmN n=1 Tax=Suipraeoptans intestinalis TaxID=2606628 RepID=UPI0023F362EF|nr:23S rRNA (adenine(2503)-C(2))-methyltransferase RlmN [Suipraeoptans intestinalis]MDD7770126.1 23S rRNA (adenine(2503)-C(2))-methyltransferase RlmN [Suipraeoptans intestinalis]MDY3121444.1 23S rRNA (adenine(2503)-C(2))-methyltransferase RlmN [Suipraeoptans intestinalis]